MTYRDGISATEGYFQVRAALFEMEYCVKQRYELKSRSQQCPLIAYVFQNLQKITADSQ